MRQVGLFALALAAATAVGLAFAAFVMRAPAPDVQRLGGILAVAGAASLALAGGTARLAGGRRVGLRLRVAAVYVAGLALTLINVLAAALLMFLSSHDLLLLLLALGFSTALALLFGYAVSGAVAADLGRLAAAAQRLSGGDLAARAGLGGADEVAQLGAAFDAMAGRLQQSIERERAQERARREMVAAVSHDLRTPLTTIRAMVEAVADGVVDEPAEVRRYLGLMRGEVQHLSRLIDDLFELSQIESGALRLALAPTALPDLLAQTVAAYAAPARDGGVTLAHAAPGPLPAVRADPARVMRVLRNLIDNALRHTPAGGSVWVEAQADGPAVRVTVRDSGPGLAAEETERVFERFYRGARARSRADQPPGPGTAAPQHAGAGLGLTIARGLVQAHGGRMWAESRPGSGAAFHFTLPAAT
jgi:signal transduction histidine kinase